MKENNELTRDDIAIDHDMEVDCDEGREIAVYIETWFDVDRKFHIDTASNDDTWLNMYGRYNPFDDTLRIECEISRQDSSSYFDYEPTKAEAQLIYLYGKEVERDDEKAIAYLSAAAEHGNPYAEQLLHSIRSNLTWSASLGAIRLLHHLSRMMQNRLDDEKKGKAGGIDRKLKRRIDEKKQAHGLKQG